MKSIRNIVEILSRGIMLRRRLPSRFGRRIIYVSPEIGGLRYWRLDLGKADPELLSMVDKYITNGSVVWDIGANVGLFSFAAAVKVGNTGRVISVEADPEVTALLYKTKKVNLDLNIDIITVAASDQMGVSRFNIAERARSTNFLETAEGSTQTGGVRYSISTLTMDLDFLSKYFPMPDFLKIDVEGAEMAVLKGAKSLLTQKKPILWCEVFDNNYEDVVSFLKDLGYLSITKYGDNVLAIGNHLE